MGSRAEDGRLLREGHAWGCLDRVAAWQNCTCAIPQSRARFDLQAFPMDGKRRVASLALHGSLAGIAVLYVAFWVRLTLVQVVPAAAALGGLAWLAGRVALAAPSA